MIFWPVANAQAWLAEAMREKGVRQADVARRAQMPRQTIDAILKGRRKKGIDGETIRRLAEGMGVPVPSIETTVAHGLPDRSETAEDLLLRIKQLADEAIRLISASEDHAEVLHESQQLIEASERKPARRRPHRRG